MRLLLVGTNRGPGGTESHLVALATALAGAGHEVAAAVRSGDVVHRALAADGRVVLFPAAFERATDAVAFRNVRLACRSVRPEWIVGTFAREYWPLTLAAQLEGIPIVLFRHLRQLNRVTGRVLPRLVERLIFPSEFLREWAVTRRGVPRGRTEVLYNPVDTQHFRPRPDLRRTMRARLGFAQDDVVVGFVGRVERAKGAHTLWAALARVFEGCPDLRKGGRDADPCARLRSLWVGHGTYAPELEIAIRRSRHGARHVRVPWTDDVVPYYAAMDLLAFPSSWSETFGRVSAEAQACGVPVLGTRGGGIPETMEAGVTGLLLPQDDVAAWADAITTLARDADARCRMGHGGRQFVQQHFDAPCIAAEFIGLLERAAACRASGRRG